MILTELAVYLPKRGSLRAREIYKYVHKHVSLELKVSISLALFDIKYEYVCKYKYIPSYER